MQLYEIDHLRNLSRRLVREFGFMRNSVAGTALTLSAAHAMVEIGAGEGMTAGQLCEILLLEKSSVSRLLKKLTEAGEVEETADRTDGRTKRLSLTAKGRDTLAAIDDHSRNQVAGALRHLAPEQMKTVLDGIGLYADALARSRRQEIALVHVREPDDLAAVADLFRAYAASLNVDLCFQNFDAELAGLPGKYALPSGGLFLVRDGGGVPMGCAAFRRLEEGVAEMKRLYVTPEGRGQGLGRFLTDLVIEEAAQAGYREIRLDTLPAMQAALALYRSCGFEERGAYYDTPVAGTVFLRRSLP